MGRLGARRPKRHLNAEVNVINLVDVVLVLLIIFMVTAPMLQGGIQVNLPRAAARPLDMRDNLVITVQKDGQVAIGDQKVTYDEFVANFNVLVKSRGAQGVSVRADADARHGVVMRVLSVIKAAGIEKVGYMVEPLGR